MRQFYEGHTTDIPYLDRRLSIVQRLAANLNPKSLLDVACGRGTFLRALRSKYAHIDVKGSDISENSVEFARRSGIDAYVANVEQGLPFDAECFDCVVFGEAIEHLIDPDAALQNISYVLKRGGRLILTTPNLASWFNRIFLLLGIQPIFTETSVHVNLGRLLPALGQWKPTQGHLKIFTRRALEEMLAANGFVIEKTYGAPYPQPSIAAPFDNLMARFPSLASNFVIQARNERLLKVNYRRLPGWLDQMISPDATERESH